MSTAFWEARERVEQFAGREPDRRLAAWAARCANPRAVRVLDIGCAGGRNTVFLAGRGFESWGVDTSNAMVAETRGRLEPLLGATEAERRVRVGSMDALPWIATATVDLVLGLGVYQNAATPGEWSRALAETARVLAPGGLCLVANFTPASRPEDEALRPVPGVPDLYGGFSSGPMTLLHAPDLDAAFARHGLRPFAPTETVSADGGRRVTANALYVRP